MITKEKLKEYIDNLPGEEFTMEELIDWLVFIEKLEERIMISQGNASSITEEEMRKEIENWSR